MVKDNVPLTKDFFKVQIPPMLTAVLADYFRVYRMDSFFDEVIPTAGHVIINGILQKPPTMCILETCIG
jgi:hypothetical protein